VLLECPLLEEKWHEIMDELFEEGVSMTLGEVEMLRKAKSAPVVVKFMIVSGLMGQFQLVDSPRVKRRGRRGFEANKTKTKTVHCKC
jgi:hypothetical protein